MSTEQPQKTVPVKRIPLQINGKHRGELQIELTDTPMIVRKAAFKIARDHFHMAAPMKCVYVPLTLVNVCGEEPKRA